MKNLRNRLLGWFEFNGEASTLIVLAAARMLSATSNPTSATKGPALLNLLLQQVAEGPAECRIGTHGETHEKRTQRGALRVRGGQGPDLLAEKHA